MKSISSIVSLVLILSIIANVTGTPVVLAEAAIHFDPVTLPPGVSGALISVWGSGPGDIYAVGESGDKTVLILHYNGSEWTDISSSLPNGAVSGRLRGVWGFNASNLYVVGYRSNNEVEFPIIYHFDSGEWGDDSPALSNGWTTGSLSGLWGSGTRDIYAVGYGDNGGLADSALIFHYDENGWRDISSSLNNGLVEDGRLFGVWGSSASDVYIAGYSRMFYDFFYLPLMYHNDGSGWANIASSLPDDSDLASLYGVWGTGVDNVYVVGFDGMLSAPVIYHNDGIRWSKDNLPLPYECSYSLFRGIWGSSASDIYAVGNCRPTGIRSPLVYHRDAGGWTNISPPLPAGFVSGELLGVWGSDAGNVYAVGTGSDLPLLYHATRDVTAPVLSLPAPIAAEATDPGGAAVEFIVTATDDTDPAPVVACDHDSGDIFPVGVTTVACTASDASGNASDGTFTITVYTAPASITGAATGITTTGAVLNGTVNANFDDASVIFEYGLDTSYGNSIPSTPNPVSGGTDTPVSAGLTGLSQNVTYHFRVVATNRAGTSYGEDLAFTTRFTRLTAVFKSIAGQDGWVLESGEKTNKGGSSYNGKTLIGKDRVKDLPILTRTTDLLAGDDSYNRQLRSILSFNTSNLPDDAVILSATLKLRKREIVGSNPFTTHKNLVADIRKPYFGSAAALAPFDFQAAASYKRAGLFGKVPVGGWYISTLKAGAFRYVNLVGTTQFRLGFELDDNNDNGNDFLRFFSGDAAVSYRPVLIVRYYRP